MKPRTAIVGSGGSPNGVQTNADFGRLPDDNKYGRRIVQLSARFEF